MLARVLTALAVVAVSAAAALAESPADAARALIERYDLDPSAIDRARELLERALERDRQVETMIMLARVEFLWGDVRATTREDKLAAYERGREIARRAVELAPRNPDAHLWYAINTGRWGQTQGVLRSLFLLPTVREEADTVLSLDPRSVRGHTLAGNLFLEVPVLVGGDRAKAEEHLKKALALDPRYTVARVDLARVYIAAGRYADARRELERVVSEREPTIVADWKVKDLPRARSLLESIRDKK